MKRCLLTVAAVIWALALVAVGSSALTMMLTGTAGFAYTHILDGGVKLRPLESNFTLPVSELGV